MTRYLSLACTYFLMGQNAYGQCNTTSEADLQQRLEQANQSIEQDDLIGHGAAVRSIKESLPCLTDTLPTKPWADFLVGLAIVEYALGREWTSHIDTAYRIDLNLSLNYGPPEIRQYLPQKTISEVRRIKQDATYYLDGIPLQEIGSLTGLHIVQRNAGDEWETVVLESAPFPEKWLSPTKTTLANTPAPAKASSGKGLLISGSALTAAGAVGIASSFALSRTTENPSSGTVSTLKAVNLGSWGVAFLGAGLGITGVLTSDQNAWKLTINGSGLNLQGRLP
jgi:hypothetical protein